MHLWPPENQLTLTDIYHQIQKSMGRRDMLHVHALRATCFRVRYALPARAHAVGGKESALQDDDWIALNMHIKIR